MFFLRKDYLFQAPNTWEANFVDIILKSGTSVSVDGVAVKEGFVKIHTLERTDEILGATIVGRHAGEMISELTLAIVAGVGLRKLATVIHPYPTQASAIRQAADAYERASNCAPGTLDALLSYRE